LGEYKEWVSAMFSSSKAIDVVDAAAHHAAADAQIAV
jgi:hypothetical protein